MLKLLQNGLTHRNGLVRKGSAVLLSIPKWAHGFTATSERLASLPPVIANSFPKSGTHLLLQLIEGLPDRVNYGAFLASMTSSFQFRERSLESTRRYIRRFVPGEIVRGHLFFHELYAKQLRERNAVHYFIYRDPRSVVLSEAHYLREMNRWHRLHPYFRRLSIDDAIMLSITGFDPPIPYAGWLADENCFAVRYEDLISDQQAALIREMSTFYAKRLNTPFDVDLCVNRMAGMIEPRKSHTFRSGKRAGWREEFTAEHRRRLCEIAGDLLIRLGYEPNHEWAGIAAISPA
jgi:hypothetical protein